MAKKLHQPEMNKVTVTRGRRTRKLVIERGKWRIEKGDTVTIDGDVWEVIKVQPVRFLMSIEFRRSKAPAKPKPPSGKGSRTALEIRWIQAAHVCTKCGAHRLDHPLGAEDTPEEYIAAMVEVFREVRRVLTADGTLWVVIGDSYNAAGRQGHGTREGYKQNTNRASIAKRNTGRPTAKNLKPKDLMGIPWRLALALQADGWYLRRDNIWNKPNPMPESVEDRCTTAHEYVFHLSKSETYWYDADAIKEPAVTSPRPSARRGEFQGKTEAMSAHGRNAFRAVVEWRNKRSVWTVATTPYEEDHFAVYPPALIEPCILAATRPAGRRCDCQEIISTPTGSGPREDPSQKTGRAGMNRPRHETEGTRPITRGEQRQYAEQMRQSPYRADMQAAAGPAFQHHIRTDRSGARPLPPALLAEWLSKGWLRPADPCQCPDQPADIVLDPFCGSGTTGVVALRHDRRFVGIDLYPEYCEMARRRIEEDAPLFNVATTSTPEQATLEIYAQAQDQPGAATA